MSETDFPAGLDVFPSEADFEANLRSHIFPGIGRHSGVLRLMGSAIEALETAATDWRNPATIVDEPNGSDITDAINDAITASGWPTYPATIVVTPGEYVISDAGSGIGVLIDGGGASSTPALEIVLDGVQLETTGAVQMFRITNSIVSVTRVNIRGGTIAPNAAGASGVVLNNAEFCTITSNFFGAGGKAIRLTGTSTNNTILAGTYSNLKVGISIEGVANNLAIIGNAFAEELSGSPFCWIDVNSASLQSLCVVVAGNRFRGIGAVGFPPTKPIVNVPYGYAWSIVGNTFHDCETTAIFIGGNGSSYGHTIDGNTFTENKASDIVIDGGKGCAVGNNRHGARASGTTVSTYYAVDVRDPFAVNGGSGTVITGYTSADTGTALDKAIKIAATCQGCVVIGSAAIASTVAADTLYLDAQHKPTIAGSRGGNAALADLLTKGATAGLWIDGSS